MQNKLKLIFDWLSNEEKNKLIMSDSRLANDFEYSYRFPYETLTVENLYKFCMMLKDGKAPANYSS